MKKNIIFLVLWIHAQSAHTSHTILTWPLTIANIITALEESRKISSNRIKVLTFNGLELLVFQIKNIPCKITDTNRQKIYNLANNTQRYIFAKVLDRFSTKTYNKLIEEAKKHYRELSTSSSLISNEFKVCLDISLSLLNKADEIKTYRAELPCKSLRELDNPDFNTENSLSELKKSAMDQAKIIAFDHLFKEEKYILQTH